MNRTFFRLFLAFLLSPTLAFAGAAVTYHGRIFGPNGDPVEAVGVTFKIQVRSPGVSNCLLYEESRTVDMRNSEGIFVIPIGDGSSSRTASDPGITIEDVFSNNPVNHTGLTCNSGHAYQPSALDARKLVVTFNDGSGAGDQVLPPMDINYVPFSLHAEEATRALSIGSVAASQIMSVAAGTATPLTAANFAELLLLVNGTSTAYVKPASVPTCASGEVLKGTGGAFVCVTDSSGSDTLAGLSCADGKILKRSAGAWACADESGVGTESDPTVQPYAKVAPGTGLTVSAGAIVPDFGTAAGKVAQGNDSRFTDARAPNGSATGDLAGSYPNPTVKGLRGNAIANTTPLNGQVYQWVLGSTEWQPKYLSFADLKKSDGTAQMPASCAANQTLAWSAITDVFTCADIGSLDASKITTGTLSASRLPTDTMILTCADGKIAKRVAGAWACADDVGVGSEVDPSVAAYAKNPPATGLIVDGSNKIAPDFGTGAGKIVQGNDSRLSDNRVASDINGVVSTGILQRTGAGTFSTLGVAAPVTNSAGNIGLAVGTGLTLNSGSLVPDFGTASGKIAQGNDSRFPSSTCASGNYNRWNGSAWVCDADAATDSTKVLKSGDTMTGALNLPSNGLVVGTTQLVASSGYVGIGTSSPLDRLHISGAGTGNFTGLQISETATGGRNYGIYSTSGANTCLTSGFGIFDSTAGSCTGYRLAITSGGNIGIGTTTPAEKLEIAGNVKITGGGNGIKFPDGSTQTTAYLGSGGGGSLSYTTVTANATVAANSGTFANSASRLNLTLPATCAVGDRVEVSGLSTGGWKVLPNSGQTIYDPSGNTFTASGISSKAPRDTLALICTAANTAWQTMWSSNSANISACPTSTTTYTYTGSIQSLTVPYGCATVTIKMWGAGGGGSNSSVGGGGGYTFVNGASVTPGQSWSIIVGGGGGFGNTTYMAGGGGGRSAIQVGGSDIYAAGGGGGGGAYPSNYAGGAGGGSTGGSGLGSSTQVGTGGTQSSGGTVVVNVGGTNGSLGQGGIGGDGTGGSTQGHGGAGGFGGGGAGGLGSGGYGGGGGGGGYYGGAGGSGDGGGGGSGGGGGGSGFGGTLTAGSGQTAANNGDSDRSGAATGGNAQQAGANGRILITFSP